MKIKNFPDHPRILPWNYKKWLSPKNVKTRKNYFGTEQKNNNTSSRMLFDHFYAFILLL